MDATGAASPFDANRRVYDVMLASSGFSVHSADEHVGACQWLLVIAGRSAPR